MTVEELLPSLRQHWPRIKEQLLDGRCQPIITVLDRKNAFRGTVIDVIILLMLASAAGRQ